MNLRKRIIRITYSVLLTKTTGRFEQKFTDSTNYYVVNVLFITRDLLINISYVCVCVCVCVC